MVPERRTDPKSHVSILIMVEMVIAPVVPGPTEGWAPGVDSIVDAAIEQVSQHKAGEKRKGIEGHKEVHDPEYGAGDQYTWQWRHKEPCLVPGVVMMAAMEYVDDFHPRFTLGFKVEKPAVRDIFKEGPEEDTADKKEDNFLDRKSKGIIAMVEEIDDHRQVHRPDDQGMSFGQPFQCGAVKQPRLTRIFNFLDMHTQEVFSTGAKIRIMAKKDKNIFLL